MIDSHKACALKALSRIVRLISRQFTEESLWRFPYSILFDILAEAEKSDEFDSVSLEVNPSTPAHFLGIVSAIACFPSILPPLRHDVEKVITHMTFYSFNCSPPSWILDWVFIQNCVSHIICSFCLSAYSIDPSTNMCAHDHRPSWHWSCCCPVHPRIHLFGLWTIRRSCYCWNCLFVFMFSW